MMTDSSQPVAKGPAAFDGRCIPSDGVVPRSNMADMLPRHALSAGRLARLGATRGFTTDCSASRVARGGWIPRLGMLAACVLLGAVGADARVTRIEITHVESPTFEGRHFGTAGPYKKLRGKAHGEVDPDDPRNAVITDIELAPRNARGMVEYSMDIYILRPVDPGRGSRKLLLEVNNRGNKLSGILNHRRLGFSARNDPTAAADAGDGFLMERGYLLAWNGWDVGAAPDNGRLTITVPVASRPDGAAIEGPSYEYINFDNDRTTEYTLTYPAATLDQGRAALTVKRLLNDPPTPVAADGWEYVDARTIRLLPLGTAFEQSHIYEFTYPATEPLIAGLGLAATRDFVSFLRHAASDDAGNPNPLAGNVEHVLSWAYSQSARYLNDFLTLGFNEDEQGRRVIDGMENAIGGGSGAGINYRFAQTGRTERNRQHRFFPEAVFPFAYPELHDPVSGRTGGRGARCLASGTCPRVFEINSANEYWVKAASLLHTDTEGHDLADPEHVRFFLVAGTQHGTGRAGRRGSCQQLQNPTDSAPVLRALLVALDEWVTEGVAPPDSRVPRVSDGTAVFSVPQPATVTGMVPRTKLGFPAIPGVSYTGVFSTRYLFDFGPEFDAGILGHQPPAFSGRPTYPAFVSRTDEDGNEVAGIRVPPVAAPVATTTGWALRGEGYGLGDGCEASGQLVPFPQTRAARLASGDPRRSLEERYGTHEGYVAAVTEAARKLARERLLLERDVQRYIDEGAASDVLR